MGVTFWLEPNKGETIDPASLGLTDFKHFCDLVGAGMPDHRPIQELIDLAMERGLALDSLVRVTSVPVDLDFAAQLMGELSEDEQAETWEELRVHNAWAEACWQDCGEFSQALITWQTTLAASTADSFDVYFDQRPVRRVMQNAVECLLVLVNVAVELGATKVRMRAEW